MGNFFVCDLIETLWNVKETVIDSVINDMRDLIETLWNVKVGANAGKLFSTGI